MRKMTLDDVIEIAGRRRAWLIGGALAGLLVAYALMVLSAPWYRAHSVVLYESAEVPKEFFRQSVAVSFRERAATFEERLRGAENVARLVAKLAPALEEQGYEPEAHAGYVRRHLEFQVLNAASRDYVFQVGFTSRDPELAADAVRSVIGLLIEGAREERQQQAQLTASLLDEELAKLKTDLDERQIALNEAQQAMRAAAEQVESERVARAALAQTRNDLTRAETVYTAEHPEVQRLRREVARRKAALAGAPDSSAQDEVAELQAAYDTAATRYQQLLNRRMEAEMSGGFDERRGDSFQLLQPPAVPKHPVWPNGLIVYPGGLAAGVVLALLLVAVAEFRMPVFGTVSDLRTSANLPVLASIPRIDRRRLVDLQDTNEVDHRVVVHTAPESAVAEQYRGFLPVMLDHRAPTVVVVTSASRGDGKSVTTANLAASVASDLRRQVLLVDADLRRPTLHNLLHRSRKPGLTEVLQGKASLAESVVATPIANLCLLPAGRSPSRPLSLLTADAFDELIEVARGSYQAIFIDTPPLLAVVDARILRRAADVALLVVRAGATPREPVLRSFETLGETSGLVLNEIAPGSYRRHYYGEAYSRYAYGDEASSDEA